MFEESNVEKVNVEFLMTRTSLYDDFKYEHPMHFYVGSHKGLGEENLSTIMTHLSIL